MAVPQKETITFLTTQPILPNTAPTITTERLVLRPFLANDLKAFHILRSDPEGMLHSPTHRPDAEESVSAEKVRPMLPPQNRTSGTETYLYAVEERRNPGVLVGDMGCHVARPGHEEVGYQLARALWGNGLATEGLKAFMEHWWLLERKETQRTVTVDDDDPFFAPPQFTRTVTVDGKEMRYSPEVVRALVETVHVRSIKVLEKCGFTKSREIDPKNGDYLFELVCRNPGEE